MLDYASRKLHLITGVVRIGQISGTADNPRGWNRTEWLPSLVLSSRHIRALPDTLSIGSSNSSGVMSDVDWIPVDKLAEIVLELAFGLQEDTAKDSTGAVFYHAVNPNPVTWKSLLPTVKSTLERTRLIGGAEGLENIEIVSLHDWVHRLAMTAPSALSADVVYQNPAIRLLDFFESLLVLESSFQRCSFATFRTFTVSDSFKRLEPNRKDWIAGWIDEWVASLVN